MSYESPNALESYSDEELQKLYKEEVGVDASLRDLGREEVMKGISDPKSERERLRLLDLEEDRLERNETYRR